MLANKQINCLKLFSFFLFSLIGYNSFAQYGKLTIEITVDNEQKHNFIKAYKIEDNHDSLIYSEEINDFIYTEIDSLNPGNYFYTISKDSLSKEIIYKAPFQIKEDKSTSINFELIVSKTYYHSFDKKTRKDLLNERIEGRFELGYNSNGLIDKSKYLNQNFNIHITELSWIHLSKHFGLLIGGGLGTSQHLFNKDTTFIQSNGYKKRNERYSYWQGTINFDARLSSGNQKLNIDFPSKLILDIGSSYHLPIFFRHITNYENNLKITNKYIHQFTDLRFHINFGYEPVLFSIEYRYLDFILGNYPEIPKYMFSLKLNFHD